VNLQTALSAGRLAGAIFILPFSAWRRKLSTLVLAGLLLGGFGLSPASGTEDGDYKLTDSQRTVVATSAAWSNITTLADGSLGLVYEKAQSTSVGGPNVSLEWIRSTDSGLSWSAPITVAERLGSGGQLYDPSGDGGYIVYEQRNQALGQMPNGRIVCSMGNLDYYYDSEGHAVSQGAHGSTFRYTGMTYTYSDDLGQTWHPLQSLPSGPFGGVHQTDTYIAAGAHGRIVTLSDGTALMSLLGSRDPAYTGPLSIPAGTTSMSGVLRSTDNGLTWGDPSLIMSKTSGGIYEESALCLLSGDKLLAEVRTPADTLVQYTSADLGRTWQEGAAVTQSGQIPGSAFQLADGKLMLTWGNRRSPYGAMAMIGSVDGNGVTTWDYDHRVSLAWDSSDPACGYANGAQAGDGSIIVTYYENAWSGNVYTVRFTENQFLQAAGLPPVPEPSALVLLATGLLGLLYYAWRKRR
jgi:hypothetical protein